MTQPHLDFTPALQPSFDSGVALTQADQVRLTGQIARVLDVISDGEWWSVYGIAFAIERDHGIKDPENSIQAQVRNLRKPKHGGYDVRRKRVGNLSVYRLFVEGK